ncbi:MAG: hypothetical protein R2838_17110 [Caldilineaceae bacterium]
MAQCGPWTIYHSGDTVRYPGMDDILRAWPIDVAILPINGSRPERRVAGNLDGAAAAQLAPRHRRGRGDPVPLRDVRIQHRAARSVRGHLPRPRPTLCHPARRRTPALRESEPP